MTDALDPGALDGARVQRVDTPRPDQTVLEVRWRAGDGFDKGFLVLGPDGIVLAAERPRGDAVDGFGRRLRKLLTGAFVVAIEARGTQGRIRLERGPKGDRTEVSLGSEQGAPVLRAADGRPLAGRKRLATVTPSDGWTAIGIPRGPATPPRARRSELAKVGRRRRTALRRTIGAVRRDIERVHRVEALRQRANVLKAHAHQWSQGMAELEVTDFHADPPRVERWKVDPASGPSAEADALFHQARRFERGAELGAERLKGLEKELAELDGWLAAEPDDPDALDAWEGEGRSLGLSPSRRSGGGRREKVAPRLPYRRFLGAGDRPILVGRGALANDELTLRHARPWDLWLHAKGRRGAHVVISLEKRETCPPDLLVDAAMLAAHFSEAAGDAIVDVSYTPRRHVHKRKGDPPGAVRPSREKVIAVRMDPDRVRSLVAAER